MGMTLPKHQQKAKLLLSLVAGVGASICWDGAIPRGWPGRHCRPEEEWLENFRQKTLPETQLGLWPKFVGC